MSIMKLNLTNKERFLFKLENEVQKIPQEKSKFFVVLLSSRERW